MDQFFCVLENYPTLKRKDGTMVNIIKEEISLEESLKKKLELFVIFVILLLYL